MAYSPGGSRAREDAGQGLCEELVLSVLRAGLSADGEKLARRCQSLHPVFLSGCVPWPVEPRDSTKYVRVDAGVG